MTADDCPICGTPNLFEPDNIARLCSECGTPIRPNTQPNTTKGTPR